MYLPKLFKFFKIIIIDYKITQSTYLINLKTLFLTWNLEISIYHQCTHKNH